MRLSLPRFSPDAQYVAARPLLLNGIQVSSGQPVHVDIYRMRQLYHARRVVPVIQAVSTAAPVQSTPVAPIASTFNRRDWKEDKYGKRKI